jgi:hypothetical protein
MVETPRQPTASHEENQQQGINDKNRYRVFYEAHAPMDQNVKNSGAQENPVNNISEVPNTGVTPESMVKPQGNKDEPSNQDEPRNHLKEKRDFLIRNHAIESNPKSQIIGQRDQYDVESDVEKSPIF